MGFETDTLALLAQALQRRKPPRVRALHLPPGRPEDACAGESCALALDDGSVGLSYALFGDTLAAWRRLAPTLGGADPFDLAQGLASPADASGLAARGLGLAAVNALTAWLYRQAGFEPPPAADSCGGLEPAPGECVGMVGWFPPLVPRLRAAGAELRVLELREELHGPREGALVGGDAALLEPCTQVLATGTVLLNGSFEAVRAHCGRARRFVLVGPSAGLLPYALFARGVDGIGGSWVDDPAAFLDALQTGDRRRGARKFFLERGLHPSAAELIDRL